MYPSLQSVHGCHMSHPTFGIIPKSFTRSQCQADGMRNAAARGKEDDF